MFYILNLFASGTQMLELCVMVRVDYMYAWILIVVSSFLFPAIESNDDCAEEGEVFEYQEDGDQGQANQGKPSTCCIYES
jgi:hypothetical protein